MLDSPYQIVFKNFNPRSPCGERRLLSSTDVIRPLFQSTLPVWGATGAVLQHEFLLPISIHAPRVGSDSNAAAGRSAVFLISIHAPRVGSDLLLTCASVKACLFQSTLPVWGAT